MAQKVKGGGTVDALVASGDFVSGKQNHEDRRKAWRRSVDLVTQLARDLGVPMSNVLVCPGNHDVIRKELDAGQDGLSEYNTMLLSPLAEASRPGSVRRRELTAFASIVRLQSRTGGPVFGLELNMMHAARRLEVRWKTKSRVDEDETALTEPETMRFPGVVSPAECSELTSKLLQVWESGLLLIAGHFPINTFDWYQAYQESTIEKSRVSFWPMNHLASGWGNVLAEIRNACEGTQRQALMLHGDTHHRMPVSRIGPSLFASTAGRLDDPLQSAIPCHFRAYNIDRRGIENSVYENFEFSSATDLPESKDSAAALEGEWTVDSTTDFPPATPVQQVTRQLSCEADDICDKLGTLAGNRGLDTRRELLKAIRDWNLFELRRVAVSSDSKNVARNERLGHVRLGPLLNQEQFFYGIVSLFGEWARQRYKWLENDPEDCLILGVDAWGAALATELGLRLNSVSRGVTMRGLNKTQRTEAIESRSVAKIVRHKRRFLIVSDVVVTGQTLRDLHEILMELTDGEANIAGVCVIAGKASKLCGDMSVPFEIGAVLTSLEIPVVPRHWLPNVDVLPAESFGFGPFST